MLLKEPIPIVSTFFQTFGDFGITRKLICFWAWQIGKPMAYFRAGKCSVWKISMFILKQMVWEIKKWHLNFSRPIGSWVISQNGILHVLIKTQEPWGLPKFSCHFGVSQTICWKINIIFQKKKKLCWWIWDGAQNVQNPCLGAFSTWEYNFEHQ